MDTSHSATNEQRSIPDMLADLDLSRGATYFYLHPPGAPDMGFLTDGTTAYLGGTQQDGQKVYAKVEDENPLPYAVWTDSRIACPNLNIARQGPYFQTTWVWTDGIFTLQPRTLQYPKILRTGEYSSSVLTAMSSARRLKWGTATTAGQAQEIDAMAVHMTDEGLHQLSTDTSVAHAFLQSTHSLFTPRVGQGPSTTSQQEPSGGVSGTELHVPGEWVQEED